MKATEDVTIKPHFLYVFSLLSPYLSLLIIPILRGFIKFLLGFETRLSSFLAAEIIIFLLAVLAAVVKLRSVKITFGDSIRIKKGVFIKVNYTISSDSPKVLMLESNPVLRLFNAFRLKIYTEAGSRRRPDESLPITAAQAKLLYQKFSVKGQTVRSNTAGNLIMSAALSSWTTGILLAVPIFKALASVVGKSIPSLLYDIGDITKMSVWIKNLSQYFPVVLLLGYAISFAVLLVRNSRFSSVRSKNKIMLDSGLICHRTMILESASVNAVKTVKAPLMILADKCVVKFSSCGFGRLKGEIGLLIPCVKPSLARGLTRWLLPQFEGKGIAVRPKKSALKRCFAIPLLLAAVLCVAAKVIANNIKLQGIILGLLSVLLILILLFVILRVYILFNGTFSMNKDNLMMRYKSGFSVIDLNSKMSKVGCIIIKQTLFDKRHKQCTVKIKSFDKNREKASLRFLDYNEVKMLIYNSQ